MTISLLLTSPLPHAIVTKMPPAACRKIETVPQVAVHAPVVAKMITTLPYWRAEAMTLIMRHFQMNPYLIATPILFHGESYHKTQLPLLVLSNRISAAVRVLRAVPTRLAPPMRKAPPLPVALSFPTKAL